MAILASNNPFTTQPAIVTPTLFKGNFISVASLVETHPNPEAGSTANIIRNGATDDLAIWDTGDATWVIFPGQALDITGKVDKVTGYSLTKNDLTDLLKTAYNNVVTWVSINGTNLLNHLLRTDNPHSVTKTQVGLDQVDNTSDLAKPVSTLQATADANTLNSANTYADSLITQLIDNAPADANTLKELNDKILAVQAIIGGTTADGDALVNTVAELLAVFSTYTEGVDLVTLLAGKVNTNDVYNALDGIVAGKVLDARQGKALKDLIDALTTEVSGKEDTSNKSQDIETDKASTTKYSSVKQLFDWAVGKFQAILVSGTNIKTINSTSILGSGNLVISATTDPAQITITTTVSITTDTLDALGKGQKEKNVIIDNGVNAINITVNGGTNFLASYLKHGTGAITFVQGAGRTLRQVDATAVLNGAVGSTATISSIGTTDYLRISNA